MNILRKLFDFSGNDEADDSFHGWGDVDIDEHTVRDLIQTRIYFLQTVRPSVPDLDDLLKDIAKTEEQKAAIRRIWREEAENYMAKLRLL